MSKTAQQLLDTLISPLRKPITYDEGALRIRVGKGNEADALLQNETFVSLMDDVGDFYMNAWRSSAVEDVEVREKCHVAIQILGDLKTNLKSRVRDGEAARETLKKIIRPSI